MKISKIKSALFLGGAASGAVAGFVGAPSGFKRDGAYQGLLSGAVTGLAIATAPKLAKVVAKGHSKAFRKGAIMAERKGKLMFRRIRGRIVPVRMK